MTAMLTESTLDTIRQRRSAGESLKALALELGVTWQKLDKAIRNGLRREVTQKDIPHIGSHPEADMAVLRASTGAGPLTEKYRPRTLDAVWGQDKAVATLRAFVANPYSTAFVFEGDTGTGKTSAAMALAAELGCDLTQNPPEFGGLHVIASGEQTADTIRELYDKLTCRPFFGSGWKVLIVNECDRMSVAAETIWLDRLENLPSQTVIVFTTNYAEKLSQRFRDRCTRLSFVSDASTLNAPARTFARAIWLNETGSWPTDMDVTNVVRLACEDRKISFRRIVQVLAKTLPTMKASAK
jgi:hypothetical protein